MTIPWLTIMAGLPLLGAVVLVLMPRGRGALAPQIALGTSLVALVVGLWAALTEFEAGAGFQLTEQHEWIPTLGAFYALGVDGIGLTLVLMTLVLTPVVVLASWHDGDDGRWSSNAFFAWILGLEGLAIGVFAATDVFLFYVLFEATLIPIYFLIGGFGGGKRSYAAVKFLLFSLFGGLLMLASVVGLFVVSNDAGTPSYLLAGPDGLADGRDHRPAGCSSGSSWRSRSRRRCSRCTPGCPTPRSRPPPARRCCWSACWTRSARSA